MSVPRRGVFFGKCVFIYETYIFLFFIRRTVSFEELGLPAKFAVYERYGNSDTTIGSASKNAAIWWY